MLVIPCKIYAKITDKASEGNYASQAKGNGESLITLSRALASCGQQRFTNVPSFF